MDAAAQVDMLAKRLDNDNLTSVIRYTSFLINEKENKEARGPLFLMLYFGASMILYLSTNAVNLLQNT